MRSKSLILGASLVLLLGFLMDLLPHLRTHLKLPTLVKCFHTWHHATEITIHKQYRRVRLKTRGELDRSYHLLMVYIKHPDLASSVEELELDKPRRHRAYSHISKDKSTRKEQDFIEYDKDETEIHGLVKQLNLEETQELKTLQTLFRKKWKLSLNNQAEARDSFKYDWSDDANFAQALSPLLFLLCPNIRKFKTSAVHSPLQAFMLQANYGLLPVPHVQHLQDVRYVLNHGIDLYDERYYNRFDILGQMRLFHRLPSIESMTVAGICEHPNGRTILPPHVSNLKRISITHSDIASMILASVIRLPKALEEFTFSVGGRATVDTGYALMYPKTLGKALLCQKSSLRKLDLDVDSYLFVRPGDGEQEDVGDEYYPEWEEEELAWQRDKYFELDESESTGALWTKDLPNTRPYGSTIGSLHDFQALTHLSLGVKLLLGSDSRAPFRLVDALPPSLEYLCIRGYKAGENAEYTRQVEELMEIREVKFPNLREILGIDDEILSGDQWRTRQGEIEDVIWEEEVEDIGWIDA